MEVEIWVARRERRGGGGDGRCGGGGGGGGSGGDGQRGGWEAVAAAGLELGGEQRHLGFQRGDLGACARFEVVEGALELVRLRRWL